MKKMLIAMMAALSCFIAGAEVDFKVGFSRVDITPPLGTPLAGYFNYRGATGILDPLECICIAVSDGEKTALLYSLDHLHLTNDAVKKAKDAVIKATGLPADAIYVSSTHTHLGPHSSTTNAELKASIEFANGIIAAGMADSARFAIEDLAAAKIAIARGEAKGLSFIRRFKMKDGSTRTNPGIRNPQIAGPIGSTDDSVQLVRFVREGKKDVAIINFQTHPDVIGGTKYSADWPGFARRQFEKALEGEVLAAVFNGAQGDTNHIDVNTDDSKRASGYGRSRHMGRKVAGVALGLWDITRPVEAGRIGYRVATVKIPTKTVDPAKISEYRRIAMLYRENRTGEIKETGMERTTVIAEALHVLDVIDRKIASYDMPMSTVTIGTSLAFCGFPGEPFTELGLAVKKASPFTMTVINCCNGGSFGYLPTESAYDEGGYEQRSSRYARGVGERLAAGGISSLDALYREAKQ